jgi:hypothetical protein
LVSTCVPYSDVPTAPSLPLLWYLHKCRNCNAASACLCTPHPALSPRTRGERENRCVIDVVVVPLPLAREGWPDEGHRRWRSSRAARITEPSLTRLTRRVTNDGMPTIDRNPTRKRGSERTVWNRRSRSGDSRGVSLTPFRVKKCLTALPLSPRVRGERVAEGRVRGALGIGDCSRIGI